DSTAWPPALKSLAFHGRITIGGRPPGGNATITASLLSDAALLRKSDPVTTSLRARYPPPNAPVRTSTPLRPSAFSPLANVAVLPDGTDVHTSDSRGDARQGDAQRITAKAVGLNMGGEATRSGPDCQAKKPADGRGLGGLVLAQLRAGVRCCRGRRTDRGRR